MGSAPPRAGSGCERTDRLSTADLGEEVEQSREALHAGRRERRVGLPDVDAQLLHGGLHQLLEVRVEQVRLLLVLVQLVIRLSACAEAELRRSSRWRRAGRGELLPPHRLLCRPAGRVRGRESARGRVETGSPCRTRSARRGRPSPRRGEVRPARVHSAWLLPHRSTCNMSRSPLQLPTSSPRRSLQAVLEARRQGAVEAVPVLRIGLVQHPATQSMTTAVVEQLWGVRSLECVGVLGQSFSWDSVGAALLPLVPLGREELRRRNETAPPPSHGRLTDHLAMAWSCSAISLPTRVLRNRPPSGY